MLSTICFAGDGMDPALVALLAAAGKSASSLPGDMAAALTNGKVSSWLGAHQASRQAVLQHATVWHSTACRVACRPCMLLLWAQCLKTSAEGP
jgi:hypothetical protein